MTFLVLKSWEVVDLGEWWRSSSLSGDEQGYFEEAGADVWVVGQVLCPASVIGDEIPLHSVE